jgi:hypothetical protein
MAHYERLAERAERRAKVASIVGGVARLGHFMCCFRLRLSDVLSGGRKLGLFSALKPNPAKAGILFTHGLIAGFARPFKTFFCPFSIVSGRRHRFRPSPRGNRNINQLALLAMPTLTSIKQILAPHNAVRRRFPLRWSISAPAARCARSARPVQIHGHWRIEAPRNRFSWRTFRCKLGRKAARSLGLGGGAATIYSHSQERRDLFALGHALSLGRRAARSIRSNGLVFDVLELLSVFI